MTQEPGHARAENRTNSSALIALGAVLLIASGTATRLVADDFRGVQFIGFTSFSNFNVTVSRQPAECILLSPEIQTAIPWDELVPSWNIAAGSSAGFKIEVRPISNPVRSPFYTLGLWSTDTNAYPRKSVANQNDPHARVQTDTLILKQRSRYLQLRLTFSGVTNACDLKFVGVCIRDSASPHVPLQPCRTAWGKSVPVPERSQMGFPNGEELCSPATLSMLMAFWAQKLHRPDLDKTVPEIQRAIFDDTWGGTGNWPFNTAYAGSFPGIRAYVSRFSDLSELEQWVACGRPVGLSVCYNKLRGKSGEPSGHLVVCVGFTETGDPIINDPGTSRGVRKTFLRRNLIEAWGHSHNTVYLVHAEGTPLPEDRFGHWSPRP